MNEILNLLLKIGIFLVLAQTLLHFNANENYTKYVQIIINLMILSMLLVPMIGIFKEGTLHKFEEEVRQYQKQLQMLDSEELPDIEVLELTEIQEIQNNEIQEQMKNEIKSRINNELKLGEIEAEVLKVEIDGKKADGTFVRKKMKIDVWIEVTSRGITKGDEKENLHGEYQKLCAKILETEEQYLEVHINE